MKHMKKLLLNLLLLFPLSVPAQTDSAQCCNVYPAATIEANGLVTATIGQNEYAYFSVNDGEVITYARKFKFWTFQPGIHKICATTTSAEGTTCTTCLFYEVDTIDSARSLDCINPEWIDTSGVYIFQPHTVCGCDGVEYFSEWTARQHGVTRYAVGPCCWLDSLGGSPVENIESAEIGSFVKLYPNPTLNAVTVSAYQLDVVMVYDVQGRILERVECMSDTVTVDVSRALPGALIFKIQVDGKTINKTVIFAGN
jgi:hypothetical protein